MKAGVNFATLAEVDEFDIGDDIESFDLGLVGGIGAEFGNLNLEARCTHGLMSIAKNADDDDEQTKNRVFSVTVGYRFR